MEWASESEKTHKGSFLHTQTLSSSFWDADREEKA